MFSGVSQQILNGIVPILWSGVVGDTGGCASPVYSMYSKYSVHFSIHLCKLFLCVKWIWNVWATSTTQNTHKCMYVCGHVHTCKWARLKREDYTAVLSITFSESHNYWLGSTGNVNGQCAIEAMETLSEDPSSIDKHVTSAIVSETEIISVIMAVITLVKLLCSRWQISLTYKQP